MKTPSEDGPKPTSNEKHVNENGHKEETIFYCSFCNKTFPDRYAVRKHHQRAHRTDDNFTCEVCKKGFQEKVCKLFHEGATVAHIFCKISALDIPLP